MTEMTTLDSLILSALSVSDWKNRSQIAHGMKEDLLNQYDIRRLEHLVEIGVVEKREVQKSKAKSFFEYRLKG